jgi:hypothetical protein
LVAAFADFLGACAAGFAFTAPFDFADDDEAFARRAGFAGESATGSTRSRSAGAPAPRTSESSCSGVSDGGAAT